MLAAVASPKGVPVDHAPKPGPKNLVVCCNDTGNDISENISNVLQRSLVLTFVNASRMPVVMAARSA